METQKITAKINGKLRELAGGTTVEEYIKSLGLNPRRCVAEINASAYNYEGFKNTVINDGDVLEIMSVVAGG